ncbi:LPXTG cell wall anchor domain-containing protein, partial [Glutamicibacter sp. NPDC087344]|uniref:LPXTG cell wall anchor domain-containing protein n=1 Tax=Glutamicibacter sp. NPDC087344 TaxID=3363994 RepID=UPI003814467C
TPTEPTEPTTPTEPTEPTTPTEPTEPTTPTEPTEPTTPTESETGSHGEQQNADNDELAKTGFAGYSLALVGILLLLLGSIFMVRRGRHL